MAKKSGFKAIVYVILIAIALGGGYVGYKAVAEPAPPAYADSITIASFNMQAFGQSKANKSEVVGAIASIIRNYDIIAVQEIRDAEGTAFPKLVDEVNSMPGARYDYVIGERLGSTSSKEQYAFLYNTNKVAFLRDSNYTYNGTGFERPPLLGKFYASGFSFVLADVHTKPENAASEVGLLAGVVADAKQRFAGEDDFIVVGDYNADCSYMSAGELATSPFRAAEFTWVVKDDVDTTVKSTDCAYDRIVLTDASDYAGEYGVYRFDQALLLNQTQAEAVSDHYPVWAKFYTGRDKN
jgi:endonuclease/exonuclease/phosphatase family metal-dependent hydrolase